MQRRNGMAHQMRLANVDWNAQFLGRLTCRDCNTLVPRGSDRPFCLEHAAYAQALMREIEERELALAAAAQATEAAREVEITQDGEHKTAA